MPEWLQTILAVSGSGSLLGLAVAAVMRSLPYLAKARASVVDTALVRAQTSLVKAQAKRTSEDVTAAQLQQWRTDVGNAIKRAEARADAAEQKATEAETKAKDCEAKHRVVIEGLLARIKELERDFQTLRSVPPPPLRRLSGERDDPSSARIELVQRSEGDKR